MKRIEIFNAEDEQLIPISRTNAVFDEEEKDLEYRLNKKLESEDDTVSSDIEEPDAINNSIKSVISAILITVKDYIILPSDWVAFEDKYKVEIVDDRVTEESIIDINLDVNNSKIASKAELFTYTESYNGKIEIFAKYIPEDNIVCDYIIQSPLDSIYKNVNSSTTIARLDAEIATLKNSLSNIIISKSDIIIKKDEWVQDLESDQYYYDIDDLDVNANSLISLLIDKDSLDIANKAGIKSYVDSNYETIRLYSKLIPISNITCSYIITNPYYKI